MLLINSFRLLVPGRGAEELKVKNVNKNIKIDNARANSSLFIYPVNIGFDGGMCNGDGKSSGGVILFTIILLFAAVLFGLCGDGL